MNITVERTPDSEAVLNIEVPWDEVEKASEHAYQRLAQKYNVPGFRRGHAPRALLERMLGKEAIYHEGLDSLIEESYRRAVREHELRPLAQPTLDAPEIQLGQPYRFSARVPVLTPVVLGDYLAIRVAQPAVAVSDEEVNDALERLRADQAMWLPADRPAQIGDQVVMDLKVAVGDRTISDLHDNEFTLAAERPGIFAGMDERIVGMVEGETKEFTTSIAADYANPELAGKEAHFDVTLKGVKYHELPALDDELAKSVGEFQTLDDVREALRDHLREQHETEARNQLRDQALAAATASAQVPIHPVLVSDEVDVMLRETERTLERSRITLQDFLRMTNKSEEDYRTELEPQARERVRRDLVLGAVADAEALSVTDAELEGWLAALNAVGGGKPLRLRQLSAGQRANVRNRLLRDKALERLVEIATQQGQPSGAQVAAPIAEADAAPEAAPTPAPPAAAPDTEPTGRPEVPEAQA